MVYIKIIQPFKVQGLGFHEYGQHEKYEHMWLTTISKYSKTVSN